MKKRNLGTILNIAIILLVIFIYLLFRFIYSQENYFVDKSLDQEINEKVKILDTLKRQIVRDSLHFDKLKKDDKYLEKYARENFYMHREGEEVFIVE